MKNSYQVYSVVIASFFTLLILAMEHLILIPIPKVLFEEFNISVAVSCWLISVFPIAASFSALFFAIRADQIGRKRMLQLAMLGYGLSSFGFVCFETVLGLFASRIFSGIFAGIIIPLITSIIGDVAKTKAKSTLATVLALPYPVATIVVLPLYGIFCEQYSWKVAFYLLFVVSFLCLVVISLADDHHFQNPKKRKASHSFSNLFSLLQERSVRTLLMLRFLMLVGIYGLIPNLGTWLTLNYGFTSGAIALCYLSGGIGGLFGILLSHQWIKRFPKTKSSVISIASILMGACTLLLSVELLPVEMIGFFFGVVFFWMSFRNPSFQALLVEAVSGERRVGLSVFVFMITNLAMGVGGFLSTPFLSIHNGMLHGLLYPGIFAFLSLMLIPFLILPSKTRTKQKRKSMNITVQSI